MSARLVIQAPGATSQEFPLMMAPVTIGRDPGCDLVLDFRFVSRVHARLEYGDGCYRLTDCASTNGTFVNGERIESARPLASGDRIEIGDVAIEYAEDGTGNTTLHWPARRPRTAAPVGPMLKTIVFTDVEASTALVRRLGDVAARALLREHEMITRKALVEYGGSEVKTIGDGFLASFPSATRALQCAIAIQEAFEERNRSAETPIRVRVGVNAGEPLEEEDDIFGTAVILAARIAQQARGGEILTSNVVRDLVAGRGFQFQATRDAELKGFDELICLNELSWRQPSPPSP